MNSTMALQKHKPHIGRISCQCRITNALNSKLE